MKNWPAYVAALIAIVTALLGAGQKWGELNQRLKAIEDRDHYIHGTFEVPTQ
jgi:hypothetical protein